MINMPDDNRGYANRIEGFVRRLFERVGGAIDFSLRRGEAARTDLSALIPQLERAIESQLKKESDAVTAPNLIELRYDYETYTRMGQERRDYLQRELGSSLFEYIHNRRYRTVAPVTVRIGYDAFTRGLEIRLDFGESPETVILTGSGGETVAEQSPAEAPERRCELVIRGLRTRQELRATLSSRADPIGVGRNVANELRINDATVSNFHAAFRMRPDGQVELADRSSANGTGVNGVMLGQGEKTIVRDGDRIQFGEVEMALSLTSSESE